jgi:FtsH-binding integral membrane protein
MLAQGFRKHPTLGFVGLLATGTVSGLILGPLVASLSGSVLGQSILAQAIYLTLFLFVAVTYMVFALGQTYSAPRMLLSSLAITALAGCVLGIFFSHTFLQVLTTILIGALGVVGLVCGTSEVLRDESIDEPISGALMLFAAIFNIFIASVRLLAIFNSDD